MEKRKPVMAACLPAVAFLIIEVLGQMIAEAGAITPFMLILI